MPLGDARDFRIELLPPVGVGLGAPDGLRIEPEVARPERDTYRVTSVLSYGARGDGRTDDAQAITDAIADTPDGGVIYFPARTYAMGGVFVRNRKCLTFVGDGPCSLLVLISWEGLAFEDCDGIVVQRLTFDAPGRTATRIEPPRADIASWLLGFRGSKNIRVSQCTFKDSGREPLPLEGPSPWHMGVAVMPALGELVSGERGKWKRPVSRMVTIAENSFERLGIRVEHARQVRIAWNTLTDASGPAVWVGADTHTFQPTHTDIDILGNRILNPYSDGILVMDEQHDESHRSATTSWLGEHLIAPIMKRVRVSGNTIRKLSDAARSESLGRDVRTAEEWAGIRIGVSSTAEELIRRNADREVLADNDTEHKDIVVADNHVESHHESSRAPSYGSGGRAGFDIGIDFQLGARRLDPREPEFQFLVGLIPSFQRCVIKDNTIVGFKHLGMRLMNMRWSAVHGNGIFESGGGLSLERNVFQNHVFDNRVHRLGIHGDDQFALLESIGQNLLNGNTSLQGNLLAIWARTRRWQDVFEDAAYTTDVLSNQRSGKWKTRRGDPVVGALHVLVIALSVGCGARGGPSTAADNTENVRFELLLTTERGGYGRLSVATTPDGRPIILEWEESVPTGASGMPVASGTDIAIVGTDSVAVVDSTTLARGATIAIPGEWATCGEAPDRCGSPCFDESGNLFLARGISGSPARALLRIDLARMEATANTFEAEAAARHCFATGSHVFTLMLWDPGELLLFDSDRDVFVDLLPDSSHIDGVRIDYAIGGAIDRAASVVYILGYSPIGDTPIYAVDVASWPAIVSEPMLPTDRDSAMFVEAVWPQRDGRLLTWGIGGNNRQAVALVDLRSEDPSVDIIFSSAHPGGRIRVSPVSDQLVLVTGVVEGPLLVDMRGGTYPELSSALPDDAKDAVGLPPVTPDAR